MHQFDIEGGPEDVCDCPVCNPNSVDGAYVRAILGACRLPAAPPRLRARIVTQVRIIARLIEIDTAESDRQPGQQFD